MVDFNSIAEMMQSCSAEAVHTAQDRFGFALDYSGESIKSLETILASVGSALDIVHKDTGNEEAVEQAVKLWGSYLGEVVRRNCGGEWDLVQYPRQTNPGEAAAVPALVVAGSQIYPLMKIYRRLTMGEPENVVKFYEQIRAKLSLVQPTDGLANG